MSLPHASVRGCAPNAIADRQLGRSLSSDSSEDVSNLAGSQPVRKVVAGHLDDIRRPRSEERTKLTPHLAVITGHKRGRDRPPRRNGVLENRRSNALWPATEHDLVSVDLGPAPTHKVRSQR